MVDGAQRLGQAIGSVRQQDGRAGVHGTVDQLREEIGGHLRHIAGDDQVPDRRSVGQGGEDAAKRTFAGITIGNCGEFGVAYQGGAAGRSGNGSGDGGGEVVSAKRKAGLVTPHPGTTSARQHISRASDVPGVNHKEMITLGFHRTAGFRHGAVRGIAFSDKIRENILHQLCFKIMFLGFAGGMAFAAGGDSPQRVTSVVRPDLRTGKLVRSVIVSPKPVAEVRVPEAVVAPQGKENASDERAGADAGLDETVRRIAGEQALSPQLIHSVIKVESNYNAHAVSSKGALGLMQLIPATARRFGVSDAFNPAQNIQGGAKYLRYLLDLYGENYPLALAAYNAGEGAVARYGGVPPYAETQNYVNLVRKQLQKATAKTAAPAPPAVDAKDAGPAHVVEIIQADGSVRYVAR